MNFGGQQPPFSMNIAAAEQELDMVTDLFNKIVETCHQKCIPTSYLEGELNKGESVCIDRCVAKYFDVNKKITEKLAQQQQQQQQQQQLQQQQQ